MDRKPIFMQGLYYWFPADKQSDAMSFEEQHDRCKEILSDEMIRSMNQRKGVGDTTSAVKFLTEKEAFHALKEAARALAG